MRAVGLVENGRHVVCDTGKGRGLDGKYFAEIRVASEGGVTTVTLARPDRYNALGVRSFGELREALGETEGSGETRAMILTGAGEKAFCSGALLKERAGMDADER